MTTAENTITLEVTVYAPIEKVWDAWTNPEHITQWNFASSDWRCPAAANDLQPGGGFVWRMEAKDGSMGFDFMGTYEHIDDKKFISYTMGDGRKVTIRFLPEGNTVTLIEAFEAEEENTYEQQRAGWQAILENFKKHVEVTYKDDGRGI